MTDLFDRVLVPVATEDDARTTFGAVERHLDPSSEVVAVHVIEKAGGAPDKAGVEQRELAAEDAFAVVRDRWDGVETEIRYATDVTDAIFGAAADHDVSSIVFTPREGSRILRLLTGDVALGLVTESDRPVLALPEAGTGPDVRDSGSGATADSTDGTTDGDAT